MNPSITTLIRSGELLDHYRLESLAATGGMASIFRARDTKTGRPVAVKIPHPRREKDRFVLDRFNREIEILRKFDHPGLVKVLPNEYASHRYFIMEWIEGRVLREILDEQGKLSVERAIGITLAICDVLEYIHGRGVVHRDLKPDNLMIDDADNIKLIDFGIAREAKFSLWKRAIPLEAMGTPDYVSPEQIKGKCGDGRSDIYSLGVMLFEMLTGEVPFSGLNPLAALNMRMMVDPPSPSEINPDVSLQLEAIVCRALARDPANRYRDANGLASDLLNLRIHQPEALESVLSV